MPTRPRRPLRAGPGAAGAHDTTAARPARSDRASDAWANDTSGAPARRATVRATRDTLCSPRALKAPERSFAARSAAASGASSGSPAPDRTAGAGGGHATGHRGRRLPRPAGQQLVGVRAAQRHDEVEAVEQGRGDASPVPGAGDGAAAAGPLVDALAARTGVHGGDEEEGGREGDRSPGPAHPDHSLLERLAQRLEGGDGKLAELVEEQDAVAWPG